MPDAQLNFRPDLYRSLGSLAVTLLVMAMLLFGAAGTPGWAAAWWYLALFVVVIAIAIIYLWRVDPELFSVRQRPQAGSKSWDLIYVVVTVTCFAAILPVAGLDFRFGWLQLSAPLIWLGYLLFIAGFWLTSWAQGVNRHFEVTVRIQTDRGHKVIDTGPYAVIRRRPGARPGHGTGAWFAHRGHSGTDLPHSPGASHAGRRSDARGRAARLCRVYAEGALPLGAGHLVRRQRLTRSPTPPPDRAAPPSGPA